MVCCSVDKALERARYQLGIALASALSAANGGRWRDRITGDRLVIGSLT